MTSLTQGLLRVGFKKGQDRLDALVAALRSADFANLEDLRCADGYSATSIVSSCCFGLWHCFQAADLRCIPPDSSRRSGIRCTSRQASDSLSGKWIPPTNVWDSSVLLLSMLVQVGSHCAPLAYLNHVFVHQGQKAFQDHLA